MSAKKLKVLFIIPGSGDSFYCGNCLRDNLHIGALKNSDCEIVVMPLYLPHKAGGKSPLFFSAISYYLGQKYFRHRPLPRWLKKIADSKLALKLAASMSGTTSSDGLEKLTLSMIYGSDQAFEHEINSMLGWMNSGENFDVVHLSSSLLIGLARHIKRRAKLPIICSLQDDEVWIDSLKEPYRTLAWQGIKDSLKYVDKFIVPSLFYKNFIRMKFPELENIELVRHGLVLKKYSNANDFPAAPTLGFFYRMAESSGLDVLADAFIEARKIEGLANLRLKIGGGYTGADKKFLAKIKKRLEPFKNFVEWQNDYDASAHEKFYEGISAICVPIKNQEAAGLYLFEAFALGRPALAPNTGSFPEIVQDAGFLYEPNTSDALAKAIAKLFSDKELFGALSKNAYALSQNIYNSDVLSENLQKVYMDLSNKNI